MEVDPIVLILSIHGRTYCGLDAEEAVAIAEKTIALANSTSDVEDIVDIIDLFDDVWAASLLAGTIHEGNDTAPVHPLSEKEHAANFAINSEEREQILSQPDEEWEPIRIKRPKRYKNKKYIAIKKQRNRKRRVWDKEV
jgi:hypothetical protein